MGSPVAFGGHLYLTSLDGDTFVIKAGPKHEVVRTNSVDEPVYASLAPSQGRVLVRGLGHSTASGRLTVPYRLPICVPICLPIIPSEHPRNVAVSAASIESAAALGRCRRAADRDDMRPGPDDQRRRRRPASPAASPSCRCGRAARPPACPHHGHGAVLARQVDPAGRRRPVIRLSRRSRRRPAPGSAACRCGRRRRPARRCRCSRRGRPGRRSGVGVYDDPRSSFQTTSPVAIRIAMIGRPARRLPAGHDDQILEHDRRRHLDLAAFLDPPRSRRSPPRDRG